MKRKGPVGTAIPPSHVIANQAKDKTNELAIR